MKEKKECENFVDWYNLEIAIRDQIRAQGIEFEEMRHNGTWHKAGVRVYMDGIYPTISMRTSMVSYDCDMPRYKRLMDRGFKIHIAPVNFNTMQVNFIVPEAGGQ